MAQGRPSRGESVTENLQDYVEETLQNATNLPEQADAAGAVDLAGSDVNQPQMQSITPGASASITPDTQAALEEHLAATETTGGAGQSDTANAGAADLTSASIQNEARTRINDRTNDELGMGSIRH